MIRSIQEEENNYKVEINEDATISNEHVTGYQVDIYKNDNLVAHKEMKISKDATTEFKDKHFEWNISRFFEIARRME